MVGALLGILITGVLCRLLRATGAATWLIAPLGASAVLVFAASGESSGAALVGRRWQYALRAGRGGVRPALRRSGRRGRRGGRGRRSR